MLNEAVARWLIGLVLVALVFGALITTTLWYLLRRSYRRISSEEGWEFDIREAQPRTRLGLVQGMLERTFFCLMIAFSVPGAGIAMVAWVALKMSAGWNLFGDRSPGVRVLTTHSLILNLVSMTIALIGGLISKGLIWV